MGNSGSQISSQKQIETEKHILNNSYASHQKQQNDIQNTSKTNNNNQTEFYDTQQKFDGNKHQQQYNDEDEEDEEEEQKINCNQQYKNQFNSINLQQLNNVPVQANRQLSNQQQIEIINKNKFQDNDTHSIQSQKKSNNNQIFEYNKQLTIDENSLIASQSIDKINTLKQQDYKQANIMSYYNNNQYTYSQGKFQNQNKKNSLIDNRNMDNLLYSPSKQQEFLKKSPQIPPKVIQSNLFYEDDEIRSQKEQYIDVNDENSNKNICNTSSRLKNNNNIKKQSLNQNFMNKLTIPCELCQMNVNEEDYQQHSQNCSNQRGIEGQLPTQEQNYEKFQQECTIECEVCKKQINFDDYNQHQETCDYMVDCYNCKKPVQSLQFNKHLETCIENPWVTKNNKHGQNMKMCDYCRILILFDSEQEFEQHLKEKHQDKKKKCNNCKKTIRYKYDFEYQQHLDKKCMEEEIIQNTNSHQRILLLSIEESQRYMPSDFNKKKKKNQEQTLEDKAKLQEYWDMLDRYIYEDKNKLDDNFINKIPSFSYSDKKKFLKKKSIIQQCANLQYGQQNNKKINEQNQKTMKQKLKEWDEKTCSICMDDYAPKDQLCLLPCQHIYHKHCLQQWLKKDRVCVICRKNLLEMIQ